MLGVFFNETNKVIAMLMPSERELKKWIEDLIEKDKLYVFYKSKYWGGNKDYIGLKNEVLREQNNECQICKQRGSIIKADTVHHVQFVRRHPEMALSKYYYYKGKKYRNLLAVCKSCHNELHPEKNKNRGKQEQGFTNEEKW